MPGFGDFLSGLLSPIRKGLDDVAYQAMGGPLLGQQFQTPQPVVTPQGLMAAANQQTTPAQTTSPGMLQQASAASPVATGGGPFQTPDSAGAPASAPTPNADDYYYGGADPTAALPGGQVTIPGAAATTAQPTSGNRIQQALLAGAQALQAKPTTAPWTPTPAQQRSMTSSLLGNIGAAMQMGVPIQYGIDQYRKATLDMMTTAQKARDAASHQQVLQAFTAAMGAAGDDPRAQQAVIMQFAAALPKDELVGMADVQKAYRAPADEVTHIEQSVGPNGQPVAMGITKSGKAIPLPYTPLTKPEEVGGRIIGPDGWMSADLYRTKDGNMVRLEEKNGQFRIPGTNQPFDASQVGQLIKSEKTVPVSEQTDQGVLAAWAAKQVPPIPVSAMTDAQKNQARQENAKLLEQQKADIQSATYLKEHPPMDVGTPGSGGLLDSGLKTTWNGRQYLDITDFEKKDIGALKVAANKAGIPVVDKDGAQALNDIDTTRQNMTQLWNTINQYLSATPGLRPEQAIKNKFGEIMQTNPQLAAMGQYRDAAVQAMRAVSGNKRTNQALVKMAQDNLPKDTDTLDAARAKLQTLAGLLNSIENTHLTADRSTLAPGAPPAQTPAQATAPTNAPPQAGGLFNGERVKSVKKIQ